MPHALSIAVLCAVFLYLWSFTPALTKHVPLTRRSRSRRKRHIQWMYVVGAAIAAISLHAVSVHLNG